MGRIFENMKEALNEIERDLMEMGIKVHPHTMQNKLVKNNDDYSTLEVQNYSFMILDLSDKNKCVSNLKWCEAEFKERIYPNSGNPGDAWRIRPEVWSEFLNFDGKFDYTYSERINDYNQLNLVIKELKENPDTRQAIIHVHAPKDIKVMRKDRIPCSMYYQLMIRRESLDIIYNMRSSDFDTHFAHDIWLADELRKYIADSVGLLPGLFHMNIGSLHRYKNYTKKHVF